LNIFVPPQEGKSPGGRILKVGGKVKLQSKTQDKRKAHFPAESRKLAFEHTNNRGASIYSSNVPR
jgi:hypothetical protein